MASRDTFIRTEEDVTVKMKATWRREQRDEI